MTKIDKNINKLRNKTKKKRDKLVNSLSKGNFTLTPEQRNIICKTASNTYNTFEDKIEEVFKQNKMDIVSTSFNLEKQIVSNLKKAVNPKMCNQIKTSTRILTTDGSLTMNWKKNKNILFK
jgi:hypothetical protein